MMKNRCIVGIVGFLCLSLSSFGQIRVETQKMSVSSELASIEELKRPKFNDFFTEINPLEMTFQPALVIDSANWVQLDEQAILDLDMGDVDIREDDKYYGIGRYELKSTTYYFVAMPNINGGWNVTVMVCNETGEFTDGYTIANVMYDSGEEILTHGWIEYIERSNEIILITRMKESYQNRGGEENDEVIEELHDCEVYCLREGEFALDKRADIETMNARYLMDAEK